MSDLRWHECDELAAANPIACLLCRTGKLNDWSHSTDIRLDRVENRVNWWGVTTTALSLAGAAIGLYRTFHGG